MKMEGFYHVLKIFTVKSFFMVNSTKWDDMKNPNFCMYEFCTHLTLDPEIEKKVLYLLWAMLFLWVLWYMVTTSVPS